MYLGIDIGTSAVKAVLVDDNGTAIHACTKELSVQRPHPGWSEQDPQEDIGKNMVLDGILWYFRTLIKKV